MGKRYEWQERRGGRRYVRISTPDEPVKGAKEAAAEVEAVPEIAIEPAKPKRGRPPKPVESDADVKILDAPDD